ncbi:hypothetical protein L227DRAFT_654426 [Lentinus tigrinus ALCF2SS1-6]|uniref:DUF6533 domain-containing protein n=1 Tax=Lentinus tigrinus ALCF2SS1-6 TaxID=1328759 RepID=A0A5C2S6X4_9APHY|nr:hypothetical protein L227DRAFT_654426 [Lentinus tigrinus ALCF2SS1-6]
MSSAADVLAAAIVASFKSLFIEYHCDFAASVLFLYDALITVDREVACFWTTKWSGSSLLFFANKYICVTLYIMLLFDSATFHSDKSCSSFIIALSVVQRLQLVPWAAFSALRAFVLSRSKLLGALVFILSLAPLAANLVFYGYQLTGKNLWPFGCLQSALTLYQPICIVVIVARVPLLVSDILLICITWAKLSGRDTLRDIRQSKRMTLSDIVLWDGTVYFVAIFIMNLLHLVLSVAALGPGVASDGASYVTIFTAPITSILVSHFLLQLQEANQTVIRVDSDDPLHFSRNPYDDTPGFIRSLGAVLTPGLPVPHSDDDSELYVTSRSGWDEEDEVQASESPAHVPFSSA